MIRHGSLALDGAVVWKIVQVVQKKIPTIMVAREVQSFCILEGASDPLIEQWLKFFGQFTPDMWWTKGEK